MGIFRRKSSARITREQALAAKPLRNPELEAERTEDGEVSVKIPRRKVWWLNLLAKFGSVPEYRIVALDRVGSSVWELCDGEHTVKELIGTLAQKHQLGRKEAELSMVTYLRQLAERGIIVLVVEEKKKRDRADDNDE